MGLIRYFKHLLTQSEERRAALVVDDFHRRFGYRFHNVEYLREALTHRSFVRSIDHNARSNERLEFLGDSILGAVIAEHLFKANHDFDEGDLTKTKAQLVNETSLASVALESGLNDLIFLSPDEERTGGRERHSIISDTLEAVIGAVYLDGGLRAAKDFIMRILIARKKDILANIAQPNFKGDLLEYLQARGDSPPHYEVVSESGPDHEKIFKVAVHTNGKITGTGIGATKKEAEQHAAATALDNVRKIGETDRVNDNTSKKNNHS